DLKKMGMPGGLSRIHKPKKRTICLNMSHDVTGTRKGSGWQAESPNVVRAESSSCDTPNFQTQTWQNYAFKH
ncbi:MAG: hypothetical protein LW694_11745, partial [Chitinophagaceae bacterium]|nr:hypothetical protein [Chitinophagaceae bacterium]